MAITALNAVVPFPGEFAMSNTLALLIDSLDEAAAVVFRAPKTGSIIGLDFIVGTLTSAGIVQARLETVSATNGNPTGTLVAATRNGTQNITTAGHKYIAFTTAYSATAGEEMAAVIVCDPLSTPNLTIRQGPNSTANYPYGVHFTASWAKSMNIPYILPRYSGDVSHHIGAPFMYLTNSFAQTFNSGSTPDERGIKVDFPVGMRVVGFGCNLDWDNACDVVMYDSGGTSVASVTLDPDVRGSTGSGNTRLMLSSPVEVSAGTYRIVVKPTTTSNVGLLWAEQRMFGANPNGTVARGTSRTDAGSWTDSELDYWYVYALVDGIDIPAGGGGAAQLVGGGLAR